MDMPPLTPRNYLLVLTDIEGDLSSSVGFEDPIEEIQWTLNQIQDSSEFIDIHRTLRGLGFLEGQLPKSFYPEEYSDLLHLCGPIKYIAEGWDSGPGLSGTVGHYYVHKRYVKQVHQRLIWIAKRLGKAADKLNQFDADQRSDSKQSNSKETLNDKIISNKGSEHSNFILHKAIVQEFLDSELPFLELGPILFSGSDSAYTIVESSTSWAQALTTKALDKHRELIQYLKDSEIEILELKEVYPDSHGTPHLFSGRHRFMGWDYSESELEFKGLPAQTLEDPNDLRKRYQIWKQSLEAT